MSEAAILLVPAVVGLIAGSLGWGLVHKRIYGVYWSLFGVVSLISVGLYGALDTAPGFDGIVYAIFLMGGSLPAAAALLIGGGVGLVTRPRLMLPS
ncbi:MAG: hypothetical protein AAFZ99_08235 [Pseudomonadota bacterium]